MSTISIPYNAVHDKSDSKFNKHLAARYRAALDMGVCCQPDLGDDDILRVKLLKPHRLKPTEIADIVAAGGEVQGAEVYVRVDPDQACLLADEPETWQEWLVSQAPHIVPAQPGDGFLYFGCRDGGGAWSGRKIKLLLDSGITLLTRKEFIAANPAPENP